MAKQATLAVEMSQQLVCFSAKGGNNVGSPVMLVCVMECRPNILEGKSSCMPYGIAKVRMMCSACSHAVLG